MAHKKPSPILPVFKSSLYLTILFLGIMSYMYGSLYKSSKRAHNLKILAVDLDGEVVGQSLKSAYNQLQSPDFLTLHFEQKDRFSNYASINEAVCSQRYWGVIYTHAGPTADVFAKIAGNGSSSNIRTDVITYVYNGVYYPVIGESYVAPKLQELVEITAQGFYNTTARTLLSNLDVDSGSALSALFRPITAQVIVLSPADAGPRVLLNTITMVVPPLMQFFFVMALDHISIAMHVFSTNQLRRFYLERLLGSQTFGFVGALVVTAFIYAFREDWKFSSVHFVETWLCFWLYMYISYQVMDSVIGTIVTLRFAPFFIFTWVIINVTSTLFPFELNPGWYKWGYALPAHNVWLLLASIWSDGCFLMLESALPICFAWWTLGHLTSMFALRQKCSMNRSHGVAGM